MGGKESDQLEDNIWEAFSPMCFRFRVYGVEDKHDQIIRAVESALETFKCCEGVQIEITAPDRGACKNDERSKQEEGKLVIKGFAGE